MWYRFLLIIIILVTAAGNILVCLAIARERKLQNTTNYFLMSLAIADCLVAILVMPMGMITEVLGYFPLPDYACIIFATLDVLFCTSSIWHMSTMSMDRYFTIRFPFRYGRNKTRRIMLLKIISVWAISAAVSSPIFVLGLLNVKNVVSNDACAPNNQLFKLYGSVFAFFIPFVIMITTYALTMRSLRNVLVHKRNNNREKRRKQTFGPVAQIVNQYADMSQNIRNNKLKNYRESSFLNRDSNTSDTNISRIDSRTNLFISNNSGLNLKNDNNNIQYGSINMTNQTNLINELIHHNNQHLTINYAKSCGSKKNYIQQEQEQEQQKREFPQNTETNVRKPGSDMNTLYEMTEYSKSTSSSYEALSRENEKKIQESSNIVQMTEEKAQIPISNLITSNISGISSSEEQLHPMTAIIENRIEQNESSTNDIVEPTSSTNSQTDLNSNSPTVKMPSTFYLRIIQTIVKYYLFIHPYRQCPLAIESLSNENEQNNRTIIFNRSTSTSSICSLIRKNLRTVSTQTNSLPTFDLSYIKSHYNYSLNRESIPSRLLYPNVFHSSSVEYFPRDEHSSRISGESLSNSIRRQNSYDHYSKSRMSHVRNNYSLVSSPTSFDVPQRNSNNLYSYSHRPLNRRQQYQSRSVYFLPKSNSYYTKQNQTSLQTTNINSPESSSVFQRFNPRFFSSTSQQSQQQQCTPLRLRDERIVAANERKALKVLMIIFCVFVALWTPFFICTFVSAICENCRDRISPSIWFSITWLGYSSSMANPFIYTIFSDVFRRAFTNIILCRSNDAPCSRQVSTNLQNQKPMSSYNHVNQQVLYKRHPNNEHSRISQLVPTQNALSMMDNGATIYVNRSLSNSFR